MLESGDANNSMNDGISSLINSSKLEDDPRKLFVGGLSWETTGDDLSKYFSQYGEVLESTVKQDSITKRSRGFGFVMFSDTAAIDAVTKTTVHNLKGRKIDPKRAMVNGGKEPNTKLFLGGLDPTISEEELQAWFENNQCKVIKTEWPVDKTGTGAKKGFCFVTVGSIKDMKRMCGKHEIGSSTKLVEVKEAVAKDDGMRGGRGGFRGGSTGRGGRGGGYGASPYGGSYGASSGYDASYGYGASGAYGGAYDQSYAATDYYSGGYGYGDGYGGGYGATGAYGYDSYPATGGSYGTYGAGGGDYKAKSTRGGAQSYHPYSDGSKRNDYTY